MRKLSDKRKLACKEYMSDLNWKKALQRAGYTEKYANEQGYKMLGDAEITAEIDRLITGENWLIN